MLTSFAEARIPFNLLIIEDKEDVTGLDLFAALLTSHSENESVKKINLLCLENPPRFYLPDRKTLERVNSHFFLKPCSYWNSMPSIHSYLGRLGNLSENVLFIDSLSFFIYSHSFCVIYKLLHYLKETAKQVVCLLHGDLFTPEDLEKLEYLSTGYVRLLEEDKGEDGSKLVDVIYKKPGGKVQRQREVIFVSKKLQVSSKVKDREVIGKASDVKEELKNLTTFKLDLEMSENEKQARDKLVLPYLRTGTGEVIYHPEADELEDDPDDDLDI